MSIDELEDEIIDELVDEVIEEGKSILRRFISWLHKKLAGLEDYLLKKLDNLGKKAGDKIVERA